MTLEKVINTWRQASDDLKVEIQAPLILKNQDNKEIKFELLIENFGSKKGTIILSTDDMTEFNTPEKYGYYCSALNPVNFETYDRQEIIDILNDWGYYGDKAKTPDWYNGQSWTE